jgi:hypothetical protein
MDNRAASAEWERQREYEASTKDSFEQADTDFVDGGTARRFFVGNRGRILRHLSGQVEHEEGSFDWYQQWEEWARRQWEQQKQQQGFDGQQQSSQQQGRRQKTQPKQEFQWDFNPNDPYVSFFDIASYFI